jgi:hypothetical protein
MKRLLLKIILFSVLLAIVIVPAIYSVTSGFSDRFYFKFLKKAPSLVMGSSRALLGLDPDKIDPDGNFASPFLNFAFTQATSPYGEIYYNAIMCKAAKSDGKGLFILEVGPLAISARGDSLSERKMVLSRVSFLNMDPNIDYILKNSQHPLYLFFLNNKLKSKPPTFIPHTNGWNENLKEPDSTDFAKGMEKGLKAHVGIFREFKISQYRIGWLEKTVESLSSFGRVVLVRIPVTKEMKAMEDKFSPGFNEIIGGIAKEHKAIYLDLTGVGTWKFYDVHHMTTSSAEKFSALFGDTIQKVFKEGPEQQAK